MTVAEKIRMARQLESLGVDIIEGGFPIASRGDLEGVRAVAREIRGCTVAALARARRDDIDAALDALAGAAHPRLHTFLATSDLHLHHKLRLTREQALEAISTNVRYAREHCAEVEFSAEDASRSDIDFLCEAVRWPSARAQPSSICPIRSVMPCPRNMRPCSAASSNLWTAQTASR